MEIKTLIDVYENYLESYSEKETFFSYDGKSFRGIRGSEFKERAKKFSAFLTSYGVKKGDKVLLISNDRPEWHLCDYAILSIGAVVVPLYPNMSAKETLFLAIHSEAKMAVVSSPLIAEKLSDGKNWVGDLKEVVVLEHIASIREDELLYFDESLRIGEEFLKKNKLKRAQIDENDLATIIYTSGTTDEPKGVMLTHRNFVQNALGSIRRFDLRNQKSALVFLPLAHSFERLANYAYMIAKLKISYAESIDRLLVNMREVKPTIVCTVPRLFERIYVKLMENASRSFYLKKVFIHYGVKVAIKWAKMKVLEEKTKFSLFIAHKFFDVFLYRGIRKRLGGNLRFFVSGGAPLNVDLEALFYGMGLKIVQGYGLTETSPVLTADNENNIYFGAVGKPLDNVEIKILEDGEIVAKGPNIMKGYFKNEKETKESFTEDGWFKTGDFGRIDEFGRLFITDRKKDIIVTAGGKNIAPQAIEAVLKENKYVNQAVVIGDRKPYLSVLIYPNWENVKEYATRKGVAYDTIEDLIGHPQIEHLFNNVLKRANAQLSRFEQLKSFAILKNELTIENGELTPTLKVKRRVVLEKYKDLIEKIYSESKIKNRV